MIDTIEDEIVEALQGDSDAIASLANRLRRNTGQASHPQELVSSALADEQMKVAALAERVAFLTEVDRVKREFPRVAADPQAYKFAVDADSALASAEPEMPAAKRLREAFKQTESEFGFNDTVDDVATDGMRFILKNRRGTDADIAGPDIDRVSADAEAAQAEGIAQIMLQRARQNLAEGD